MKTSLPVDQRMKLIDLYLQFWGAVGRPELIQHFDVSTATASRILKKYRTTYPENVEYRIDRRSYVRAAEFNAAFDHDPDEALELFAYGRVKRRVSLGAFGPNEAPALLAKLDNACVAGITLAIVDKCDLHVGYASGTTGITSRWVAPHAVFFSGWKWYFRAYCYKNAEFRTFIFGRVIEVTQRRKSCPKSASNLDVRWHQPVTLTLMPHTKTLHPETLKIDLGLSKEHVRNIQTTDALAGYVLNDLRVDCSAQGRLDPSAYNLQLMNRNEVLGVSSINLVPSFQSFREKAEDGQLRRRTPRYAGLSD